jgi:hypothetical protein
MAETAAPMRRLARTRKNHRREKKYYARIIGTRDRYSEPRMRPWLTNNLG